MMRLLGPLMIVAGLAALAIGMVDWRPSPERLPSAEQPAAERPAATAEGCGEAATPSDDGGTTAVDRIDDQADDDAPQVDATKGHAGAGGPAVDVVEAKVGDEASPPVLASVKPVAQEVDEGAAAAVYEIELAEPATRPLVLIFTTLDGSAAAGKDYEQQRGTLTFRTGDRSATLHARVIDDDEKEENEQFELRLTADPSALELDHRKLVTTIKDND